jgi:hypothetical protein
MTGGALGKYGTIESIFHLVELLKPNHNRGAPEQSLDQ